MSRWFSWCAVSLAVLSLCDPAVSGEAARKSAPKKKVEEPGEGKKKIRWAAIGLDGEKKVVTDEELGEIRQEIVKEAKEAAKDKTGKGKKAPRKVLKIFKTGFASEKEAEKFFEELEEKEAALKEAKAAKAAAKGSSKGAAKGAKKKAGDDHETDSE